jgi:CDP-glycerol glycerophosphotransferase (TagB/SpsB family)
MKNLLFVSFQFFLKVLDKLFPKSDNIIIFTLNSYRDYQDNVRFLFESLSKSQKIECFLLFYKEPIAHKCAINFHSFNGIILWLRSRFLVVHHGTNDIPFSHSIDYRRRKLINVWHGIPVKNLGYQIKSKVEDSIESEFDTYWSMICSSVIDSLAMQSCFKKPKSDMWLTGLPRNDLLFSEEEQLSKDLKEGLQWIDNQLNQRHMILYMPTYRDNIECNPTFNGEEIEQLNSLLKSKNAVLGVKIHPNAPSIDFGSLPVINLSESPCQEVGIFLRKADVLVTDYSSVWVDFLLLDRQIVSYCPDLLDYNENRGFLYDYKYIFPGKINETFDSFLKELRDSLSTPIDEKQLRIKQLFHAFLDGKNSERVTNKILSSL